MEIQLGVIEARYADMIWEHEPVTSSELVKMTAVEFNWKRTTAHNVLRRLIGNSRNIQRGILCQTEQTVCRRHLCGFSSGIYCSIYAGCKTDTGRSGGNS